MKLITYCNRIIEYSFYSLFLLVPLIFSGQTSELFELNKMWFTYAVTIVIASAWATKMIAQKRLEIQRTPLDIPILLFLGSQTISTIISLDSHVSFWGYYSRFNGGLLSTMTYILLYYAFVSNFPGIIETIAEKAKKHHLLSTATIVVRRLLGVSLIAGAGVAIWGIPSHFGTDPTCLVFRGTFDTSCWTEAFKPTIRAFSTLGQPAWLAAYVSVLIPIALAYFLTKFTLAKGQNINAFRYVLVFILAITFYATLIFANTRAGYLAFGIADVLFWLILYSKHVIPQKTYLRYLVMFHVLFLVCNFLFGAPLASLNKFTLPEIQNSLSAKPQRDATSPAETMQPGSVTITDSGKIRLYVWQGAFEAWKHNPLIGTGVETFAYAYYRYKPAGHNTTSEWDYLYNKAHNEYLNYLATTGLFGLGSYLAMIVVFLIITAKKILQIFTRPVTTSRFDLLLIIGLVTGYISILISNFFGFSVVIINLYFFLIPAWVFALSGTLKPEQTLRYSFGQTTAKHETAINPYQWTIIVIVLFMAAYLLIGLMRSWIADTNYALGSNLQRVGNYEAAYLYLKEATKSQPQEPVYNDELSATIGTLATALYLSKDATSAASYAQNAIDLNTKVLLEHPNNVVFWKNRVRLFYTLAQGDPANKDTYFAEALKAMEAAYTLAPNDAKITYNLAILYSENNQIDKAIEMAQKTMTLRPAYSDAYIALGLFYHTKATDKNNRIINPALHKKAIETYEQILMRVSPENKEVKETLEKWKKESV